MNADWQSLYTTNKQQEQKMNPVYFLAVIFYLFQFSQKSWNSLEKKEENKKKY